MKTTSITYIVQSQVPSTGNWLSHVEVKTLDQAREQLKIAKGYDKRGKFRIRKRTEERLVNEETVE